MIRNMNKLFLHSALIFGTMFLASQDLHAQSGNQDSMVIVPHQNTIPLAGTVDLINVSTDYFPVLQSQEVDEENGGVSNMQHIRTSEPSPFYREDISSDKKFKATVETPAIFTQFNGYSDSRYTPPDNAIAISNPGYVISCMNSTYRVFPPKSSTFIKYSSFNDALKTTLPNITEVYYDPRAIYDAENDRFIVVVLSGSVSSSSHIVILFSKTGNPADGWNAYDIPGDVFSKGFWTDYPNIGISKNDLFITGNEFDDFKNAREPMILQVDKNKGYQGQNIGYTSYEISKTSGVFTIVPASHGLGADYGDNMFLVTHSLSGGSYVRLVQITGSQASGTAKVAQNKLIYYTSLYYSSPGASDQLQSTTTYKLASGDPRIKQAFYLDSTIHYVFANYDQNTGYSDIVYCRLNLATASVDHVALGATGFNYVYPSVASIGTNSKDKSVLIGYCKSGSSIYAQTGALQCDNNFNFSPSIVVAAGLSTVLGDANTPVVRWGDYTGLCRRYNTNSCFFAGAYALSNAYQTRISEIGLNSTKISGIDPAQTENTSNVNVFPDPVIDLFSVTFDLEEPAHLNITLYDIRGRQVALFYDGRPGTGEQKFSFNKASLAPGVYSLVISSDKTAPITKKIVVK
jgi:hypothetical protein